MRDAAPTEGTPFAAEVVVRSRRFASEDSGFAVLDCDSGGARIVLVGPLVHLEERERAAVTGAWVVDRRYGPQVKVREAHPVPPSDADALTAYLRKVRHVGPRRAAALHDTYGAEVLAAIDRDPHAVFARAGLSRRARPRPRTRGTRCGPRAACTCCWPHTGSRTSRTASTSTTATAPTGSSPSGPTS